MNENNKLVDISGCITFSDKKFFQDLDAEEAMSISGGRISIFRWAARSLWRVLTNRKVIVAGEVTEAKEAH